MAGAARVLAGLVARHQLQHAQRNGRASTAGQLRQRVQRHLPPRGLGRQVQHPVDPLSRRRLELGEQRGHRLADAGGCLRQQAAPGRGRAPDLRRQRAQRRRRRRAALLRPPAPHAATARARPRARQAAAAGAQRPAPCGRAGFRCACRRAAPRPDGRCRRPSGAAGCGRTRPCSAPAGRRPAGRSPPRPGTASRPSARLRADGCGGDG